jgi:DNA-binding GntR family transcriptional regulator
LTTKAEAIALAIERDIISGTIPPGARLGQEDLSARYGVSRTPIREALRRVAALGLVAFEPHRTVRVRTLSRAEIREAFLVRAELEGLATELAAPMMDAERLSELDAAEQQFAELTDRLRADAAKGGAEPGVAVEWMQANYAFHDVIYDAAGAPYLAQLARTARLRFDRQVAWVARPGHDPLFAQAVAQHRAIRECLAARSTSGARALAREHVLAAGELFESIIDYVEGGHRVDDVQAATG